MKDKRPVLNFHKKIFLYYMVLILFISLLFFSLVLIIDRKNAIDLLRAEADIQVEYQKNLILDHMSIIKSDLLFLPQLNEMLSYREVSNERDRILIENEFLEFSKKKEEYDQIRYLDQNGNELVRINRNEGHPAIVPLDQLQYKGDRYYFSETVKLGKGEVYFSPFDLNVEHNEIEKPIKPMIRIGTPVFSRSGQKRGIIILNYLGYNLLENIKMATLTKPGVYSLLNKEGYWLYNANADREWGFMYPEKADVTMAITDPERWERIHNSSYSQLVTERYLQTSLIIKLFQDSHNSANEYWILENSIDFEELGLGWLQIIYKIRFIGLFIFLFDGIIAYILSLVVSQRDRLMREMEALALYDPLTKLPNRRLLFERVEMAANHSKRYQSHFALLFLDLDGFKSVNDTLGHDAGDQLLQIVSERLKNNVRSSDTVSRVGGDEFIILVSQVKEKEHCAMIARKILKDLAQEYCLSRGRVSVNGSIGIVFSRPQSDETVDELIRKADRAMYEIKKSGKNNFKIYQDDQE